jgi:hypothetical protein
MPPRGYVACHLFGAHSSDSILRLDPFLGYVRNPRGKFLLSFKCQRFPLEQASARSRKVRRHYSRVLVRAAVDGNVAAIAD